MKGTAKRLTFSLLVASAIGGYAVYEPGYLGDYPIYDTYAYGPPVSPIDPYYAGPPAFFNFGFESEFRHQHGFYGGHDGFHGDHHGFHGAEGHGTHGDRGGGMGGNRPQAFPHGAVIKPSPNQ